MLRPEIKFMILDADHKGASTPAPLHGLVHSVVACAGESKKSLELAKIFKEIMLADEAKIHTRRINTQYKKSQCYEGKSLSELLSEI